MKYLVALALLLFQTTQTHSQGTWTALADTAPNLNNGAMLLLTDGSVITITINDPNAVNDDSAGPVWNKLTPDSTGSYAHGKWSVIAPMAYSRIYFSSQVLQNGKVYVAGGEFGTGTSTAELYDPLANTWTPIPGVPGGYAMQDANSQMLPNGNVLQNSVYGGSTNGTANMIYDVTTNTLSAAPGCPYNDDESTWQKLPDNSILYEEINAPITARYIPALNTWINDTTMPVTLYDAYGSETGPSVMLPDGRAIFFGSNGYTVYYTPSGGTGAGSFTLGPTIPNGLGTPDAPCAMMPDGHILICLAPVPNGFNIDSIFHPISYYYDFDYTANTFTPLASPTGGQSVNQPSCSSIMLCLPDGSVLLGIEGSNQYYIYNSGRAPLPAGKPVIDSLIYGTCHDSVYIITGTLFNGISQGAAYGDDWQMATNYPMVRLVANGKTWYARTTNWNRTGLQTGTLPDTAYFTLPLGLPDGSYGLLLSANGISSDTFGFVYGCPTGIAPVAGSLQFIKAVPNPAHNQTTLQFTTTGTGNYTITLTDIFGRQILTELDKAIPGGNTHNLNLQHLATGVYVVSFTIGEEKYKARVVVQ